MAVQSGAKYRFVLKIFDYCFFREIVLQAQDETKRNTLEFNTILFVQSQWTFNNAKMCLSDLWTTGKQSKNIIWPQSRCTLLTILVYLLHLSFHETIDTLSAQIFDSLLQQWRRLGSLYTCHWAFSSTCLLLPKIKTIGGHVLCRSDVTM